MATNIKYDCIPSDLREAASEFNRLRREGEPVPRETRAKSAEYYRLLRRERDPETGARRRGRPPTYADVPADLREANRTAKLLRRAGEPVPRGTLDKVNEYQRACAGRRKRRARGGG